MVQSLQEFERSLQADLAGLHQGAQVAFAAAICDLMLPAVGGPRAGMIRPALQNAAELVWSWSRGGSVDPSEVRRTLADVERLVSTDDEPYSVQLAVDDLVVFAVAYALDATMADSVQNAVWCARQLIELADLIEAEGVNPAGTEDGLFLVVTETIRSVVRRVARDDPLALRSELADDHARITRLVLDRITRDDAGVSPLPGPEDNHAEVDR